jgi:putative toxin-antitoxin system antitoxin component (TIGR02293 family)
MVRCEEAEMEPRAVVEVMGGPSAVHGSVRGLADLRAEIARGLRVAALQKTAEHVFPDPAARRRFLHRIVPEGSYKRRAKSGRLTPAESERTARIAHIVALAEYVWEDAEAAREFLTTPHPELGDRPPIEVAVDDFGARHVEEILHGILHGLPA